MPNENRISEDIAVIKNEIKNISANFSRLEESNRKFCDKVDVLENKQISMETKMSNMNIFQVSLAVISSAIAAYLGTKE
jgi:predicted nuclease with TOPRIM domain